MKQLIIFLLLSNFFVLKAQNDQKTILKINDVAISADEFLRIYNKNKVTVFEEDKSLDEYFELFINYKLKVFEALVNRYDTIGSFQKEFTGYVEKLAAPYLIDESIDEKLVLEAYERMKTDIHAKHILVKVFPNAAPADTLAAYQKALSLRNRILRGEDFGRVAQSGSDDPSAKENNGDLGFLSSFSTLYDFENAIYSLKEGELSMPVRTSAGYHIIKVVKKRPSKGEVRVAHIMINVPNNDSVKIAQEKETIDSIYYKVKAGEDFAKLAQRFSTDKRTAPNGGELQWFDNSWRVPIEFKNAAFSLENAGDVSKPVLSHFGWHIIKLLEKRSIRPLDEIKEEIKSRISSDPARANMSKEVVIKQLKRNYNLSINEGALSDFINKIDSTILEGNWIMMNINDNNILATFADIKISADIFGKWLQEKQSAQKRIADVTIYVRMMFHNYLNEQIVKYEISQLPKKNKEFADLYQEYFNGMLLFEITDDLVWSKASKDTVGLKLFHEKNKNNYMWEHRVVTNFYTCKDELIYSKTLKLLEKQKFSPEKILSKMNKKIKDNVQLETKIYSKGDNKQIDSYEWTIGKLYGVDNKIIIEIADLLEPSPKELKDCKGLVASDYQKYLEEEWIKSLRNKYKIEINKEVLNSLKTNQ